MHALITRILAVTIVASLALSAGIAAEKEKKEEKKTRGLPYTGTVGGVDKLAKTITIATKSKSRLYHVTPETRISKAGKPATLNDAVAGEEVAAYGTEKAGKYTALSLRLGEKVKTQPKGKGK